MASILEYLRKPEKKRMINVRVPITLYADVFKQVKIDQADGYKISVTDIVLAAFKAYLIERNGDHEERMGETFKKFKANKRRTVPQGNP